LKGAAVTLTISGRKTKGTALIQSSNRKSLLVETDGAVWLPKGVSLGGLPLLWDDTRGVYRDVMTGADVICEFADGLTPRSCLKCLEHAHGKLTRQREVYTVEGELGTYVWDLSRAWEICHDGKHKPSVVPRWLLEKFLEVNKEFIPEHLDHIDPSVPGLAGQRMGGVTLFDGSHRARRCLRDGLNFEAYGLTLAESDSCLIQTHSQVADVSGEIVARELRGVIRNNPHTDVVDAKLEADEDPATAEAAIRKHLTREENKRVRLKITPRKSAKA
jgi:hypothetical protein